MGCEAPYCEEYNAEVWWKRCSNGERQGQQWVVPHRRLYADEEIRYVQGLTSHLV